MNKKGIGFAIISGILLFLSFPDFDRSYLIWISLVPLLIAIKEKDLRDAFGLGMIAGLVFNVGIIYWVTYVTMHYGGLPFYIAAVVMFLLACYLSVYVGLFTLGVRLAKGEGIPVIISAPLLWTALEYAKSNILSGFPWENLGYSQYGVTLLIQIADVTGVYGLSFLIVLVNCLFYDLVSAGSKTKATMATEIGIVVLVLALVVTYGAVRTHYFEQRIAERGKDISVALIQGNIDQSIKWNPEFQKKTIEIYSELTVKAAGEGAGPDLVIWPETAAPLFFQDVDDRHRQIVSVASDTGSGILFGSPSYLRRDDRIFLLNSAYLLTAEGKIAGRYDKTHLVPFGEYVPFRDILFFVDKMVAGVGDFIPGEKDVKPLALDGMSIGVLICYEGIFPEIGREFRKKGADLLVNITNDAWYGRTSAPYQHMSMARFRAVENRLYVARAANTGISAIVDPLGRVSEKSDLFRREAVKGTLGLLQETTFYTVYGDSFAILCLVLAALVLGISIKRRRA